MPTGRTTAPKKKRAKPPVRTACEAVLVCPFEVSLDELRSWLERHGWADVELCKSSDEGLRLTLLQREPAADGCRIFLASIPSTITAILVSLARDLAAGHAGTVSCHEVVGRDVPVPNPEEPTGFDMRARSFALTAGGEMRPLSDAHDEDSLAEQRGDFEETVGALLDDMLEPESEEAEFEHDWRGFFERTERAISTRVAELIGAVQEAGSWSIAVTGDRWMVTVVGRAGKRISVVSRKELEAIQDATKLVPTKA